MDNEGTTKENPLVFREKPYYTREEQELYYRIAIDEALNQGNQAHATHYQILLDYFLRTKDEPNPLLDFIMNHHKRNEERQNG